MTDDNHRSRIFSAVCLEIVVVGMCSCRPRNRTACASSDVRETSVFRGNGRSIKSLKSSHSFFRHRRGLADTRLLSLECVDEWWTSVRFQVPKKRQKPSQSIWIMSIKHFLLYELLNSCKNFGIGAKLAAIEAIDRVFPSCPWINYCVAAGTAHIGLLGLPFITLASVASSFWFRRRLYEMRSTRTLKRAALEERRRYARKHAAAPTLHDQAALADAQNKY
jgi:hypothetical protein